jgi:microcystin-dependent protein
MFAGNFAPSGWLFCDGQLLPISQNDTLFNLIGTTYGGDGQSTFALPDLRGRVPIHQGNAFTLAQNGGAEQVTLTVAQLPAHSHPLLATTDVGTQPNASGNLLAQLPAATTKLYRAPAGTVALSPNSLAPSGGSQPHSNFQPYLGLNFIISLFGIFPSQS